MTVSRGIMMTIKERQNFIYKDYEMDIDLDTEK